MTPVPPRRREMTEHSDAIVRELNPEQMDISIGARDPHPPKIPHPHTPTGHVQAYRCIDPDARRASLCSDASPGRAFDPPFCVK